MRATVIPMGTFNKVIKIKRILVENSSKNPVRGTNLILPIITV